MQLLLAVKSRRKTKAKVDKDFKPRHGDEDDELNLEQIDQLIVDSILHSAVELDGVLAVVNEVIDQDQQLELLEGEEDQDEEDIQALRQLIYASNDAGDENDLDPYTVDMHFYFNLEQPLFQELMRQQVQVKAPTEESLLQMDDDDLIELLLKRSSNLTALPAIDSPFHDTVPPLSPAAQQSQTSRPSTNMSAPKTSSTSNISKVKTLKPTAVGKLLPKPKQGQSTLSSFVAKKGLNMDDLLGHNIDTSYKTGDTDFDLFGGAQPDSQAESKFPPMESQSTIATLDVPKLNSASESSPSPPPPPPPPPLDDDEVEETETNKEWSPFFGHLQKDRLSSDWIALWQLTQTSFDELPLWAQSVDHVCYLLEESLQYRFGNPDTCFGNTLFDRNAESSFAPYWPKQNGSEASCLLNCFHAVINQHLILAESTKYKTFLPHPWKYNNLLMALLTVFTERSGVSEEWNSQLMQWQASDSAPENVSDQPAASKKAKKEHVLSVDRVLSPVLPSFAVTKEHIRIFCQIMHPAYRHAGSFLPNDLLPSEGKDSYWYFPMNDIEAHYLYSSMNSVDKDSPKLYLGCTRVGDNEFKSSSEIESKVMKGNVAICLSSVQKEHFGQRGSTSEALVMHAVVIWKHGDGLWSYYEPLASQRVSPTQRFVSLKDVFSNRTNTTMQRIFYHFNIQNQEEFSKAAVQNMNARIDLALAHLGLCDGMYGVTLPSCYMLTYDRRTSVPNWTFNFGKEQPSYVIEPGSPEFTLLYDLRWKQPQEYSKEASMWLQAQKLKAEPLVAIIQSESSSPEETAHAILALDVSVYTGPIVCENSYTLYDVYRSLTPGEVTGDNVINAHFVLLRDYTSHKCRVDPESSNYSLFMGTFFMQGLIADENGFSLTQPNYVHRQLQAALREVVGIKRSEELNVTVADVEMVMVPVNLANYHWVLAVAFIRERVIRFYDPLFNSTKQESFDVTHARRICSALLAAITEECRIVDANLPTGPWKFLIMTDAPRQGVNECGDYICLYADLLCDHLPVRSCSLPKSTWLKSCDPPIKNSGYAFRLKMAHDAYSNAPLSYCDHFE
jgi:hypothetical protein